MSASVACVVCGSQETSVFAEVRGVPVHTTVLWQTREEAQAAPVGDINLTFCASCGHIFNPLFDVAKTEYTQSYENSLHFSPLFQKYAEELADRLIARYDLKGKEVLEIGSGKGDFLALLVERGIRRGVGYDPTYVPGPLHRELVDRGAMVFRRELYDPQSSRYDADLLVCRQVLEHIEQPRPFLEKIARGMGTERDGVVFFEVPNAMCPLRDLDVWTLIYEHCGFYTPQSLGRLFAESGFEILSLDELYQGIFLGVEARVRHGQRSGVAAAWDLRSLVSLVELFRARFQEKVSHWQRTLRLFGDAGKRVVVWGGGARGVTFLNLADPDKVIQHVVDVNPRKAGTFVAGTGQQLVPPSFLQSFQPDVVILMNPIYEGEIIATLRSLELNPKVTVA